MCWSYQYTLLLQVYVDGTATMSTQERKASIREFYGNVLSLAYLEFCNVMLELDF